MIALRLRFLFLYSLFSFSLYSQSEYTKFERIDTDKGLPHSTVLCMLQDKTKFLWFGTKDGLCRYDFTTFISYRNKPGDNRSISHNFIKSIAEDNNGNLWIGTWGGGLNMFDPKTEKFTQYKYDKNNETTISSDFINCVLADAHGNVWIGTDNAGLDLFNSSLQRFEHFSTNVKKNEAISGNSVKVIFEDGERNLWIGTNNGLNKFDRVSNTFKKISNAIFSESNPQAEDIITDICEDATKNLWIATYGSGLNLLDRQSNSFTPVKSTRQSIPKYLLSVAVDSNGNLWIGSENEGVCVLDSKTGVAKRFVHNETDPYSISGNTINSIGKDEKSNIWFCALNGGISILNKDAEKFIHYRHNSDFQGLSDNKVISILADSESNVWIGTDGGGLNRLDSRTKKITTYIHSPVNSNSVAGNFIRDLYQDSNKNIWIGTWGDGVSVFNPSKNEFTHLRHNPQQPTSLSSNNVWAIMEDYRKRIWVGTYDAGVNVFDPNTKKFTHFRHLEGPGSISSDKILSLFEDKDGDIWLGTDEGGLNLYNAQANSFVSFKHSDSANSLSNNSVGCILQDSRGYLWLGTNLGLNKFDKKKKSFKAYFVKDGLPNDVILGILEDKQGNLWISTNNGLSKFNPVNSSFVNFTVSDGLQDNEFKENAYAKSAEGRFYFGGKNGFNEFVPEEIASTYYEPTTVLTDFLIFNKSIPVAENATSDSPLTASITHTKGITISYKQSVISFEFASLAHTPSRKRSYSYMLEGFDKEWREINSNKVTYTNLDPSDYVFKVRGLNSEGNWSTKTASLHITITPPFWLTWWFKATVLLIIGIGIVAYNQVKTRMIKRRNKILEIQVRERTQEIRLKSLEIERINGLLKADNEKLENDVEDITRARVMQKQLSFAEFKQIFPDDASCFNHLSELKWKKKFQCKKCKNDTFAIWKNPYTRRCSKCRYIESSTTFTIFHSVKFSILKGFYLLFLVHSRPNVTAEELAEIVDISSKTCMTFKRKIKQIATQKKARKKNVSWDDLILVDADENGLIRKIKALGEK
jgi:ligand-binding sensor domain-containing protein